MNCSCQNKAATIRLPDCPEQSSFGFDNHDLQKNCLTRQFQIRSKLTPVPGGGGGGGHSTFFLVGVCHADFKM